MTLRRHRTADKLRRWAQASLRRDRRPAWHDRALVRLAGQAAASQRETDRDRAASRRQICLCAGCREMLYEGEPLVDRKVYEADGSLDYIELAHPACRPDWAGEGEP